MICERLFSCDVVLMILQSPNLIFLLMEEQNPQTYPQRMLTLREQGADIQANSCFFCAPLEQNGSLGDVK